MIVVNDISAEMVVFLNIRKMKRRLRANIGVDNIGPSWLANESGMPKSKWAALDRTPQNMTIKTLRMVARGLHCTESELLSRVGLVGEYHDQS